uniref:Uncharacterized protein n=1 Tax=Romanomermis culicivorax TaxID=13658 RepID=A0A915KF54_ROMCU
MSQTNQAKPCNQQMDIRILVFRRLNRLATLAGKNMVTKRKSSGNPAPDDPSASCFNKDKIPPKSKASDLKLERKENQSKIDSVINQFKKRLKLMHLINI